MPYMPQRDLRLKALARVRIKRDKAFLHLVEQEEADLDEVAEEYADLLREELRTGEKAGPPFTVVKEDTYEPRKESKTIPQAILDVLEDVGHPMERIEVHEEAVRRGWLEEPPNGNPHKRMGVAVRRLMASDELVEVGKKKPKKIALPYMVKQEVKSVPFDF